MNRLGIAVAVLPATMTAAGACAPRQQSVTEVQSLSIRDCARTRMTGAGLRVTDETNAAGFSRGRALVGVYQESGSLNQPVGPIDRLTVAYSDSSFSMYGYTYQIDNGPNGLGTGQLPKSTRLRLLEEKIAKECPGYRPAIETDPNP